MKTSRQKILEYFRIHSAASASDLSHAMQMTPANARHHLNILVEQGALIQVGKRLPDSRRGRPERIYGLAESLRANNLGLLASLLLKIQMNPDNQEEGNSQLQALAKGLIDLAGGMLPQRHLVSRLLQSVQILNRLHYQARWEARPGAPEIYLGFCPYREIIADHPELCQMDATLLQNLAGVPVDQVDKLATVDSGGNYCRFLLSSRH